MTMLAAAVLGQQGAAAPAGPPSGYSAWFDASDTGTITATGGAVDTWADKGGDSSMLLTTFGADGGPATGSVTLNGLNTLEFSGRNGLRTAGNVQALNASTGQYTAFFVVRFDVYTLQYAASLDESVRGPQLLRSNGGSVQTLRIANNAGSNSVVTVSDATPPSAGTWMLCYAKLDASDLTLYVAGDTASSAATGGAVEPSRLGVGSEADAIGATTFDGGMAEILIYPSALSSGDTTAAVNYLTTKWGL